MLDIINGLTSKYRDEFKIERMNLLKKYIEEKGLTCDFLYIYELNSTDENKYNAVICSINGENEIVEIDKRNLDFEVQLFDVLLKKENEYYKDEKICEEISDLMNSLLNKTIEKEEKEMAELRTNGHIYKVVEKGKDRIWLVDMSLEGNEEQDVIEETSIPDETMKEIKEGTKLLFKDGKHIIL